MTILNFLFDVLSYVPKRLLLIYLVLCLLGIAYTVGWIDADVRRQNLTPSFYLKLALHALRKGEFD